MRRLILLPRGARRAPRSPPPPVRHSVRGLHHRALHAARRRPRAHPRRPDPRAHGKFYGGGGFEAHRLREQSPEQGARGVHLRRTHRRHRVRRQDRLEDRAVGRQEGRRTARRGRDEGHRRGRRVRRSALRLQGTREHRLAGRHRPDRGHRRLQAHGDAREQRRRAHLLSGRRVVRADQVRGEAHRPRRGAVVRGGARRLQGSAGRALPVRRRHRRQGKLERRQAAVLLGAHHGEPGARRRAVSRSRRPARRSCRRRTSRSRARQAPSPASMPAAVAGRLGGSRERRHGRSSTRRPSPDSARATSGRPRCSGRVDVGRRRARGRPAHRVCRRGERRRVEVEQRRHHVQADVRQAGRAVDRRDRDRSRRTRKTIWVGTGEAWMRNSRLGRRRHLQVHRRRRERGRTWVSRSPSTSRRSSSIPTNTNTVYACVPGKLWSDSDDRGVYRTTDGGKTWTKVLAGRESVDRLLADDDGPDSRRRRSSPACGTSAARAGRSAPAATGPTSPSGERAIQEY